MKPEPKKSKKNQKKEKLKQEQAELHDDRRFQNKMRQRDKLLVEKYQKQQQELYVLNIVSLQTP